MQQLKAVCLRVTCTRTESEAQVPSLASSGTVPLVRCNEFELPWQRQSRARTSRQTSTTIHWTLFWYFFRRSRAHVAGATYFGNWNNLSCPSALTSCANVERRDATRATAPLCFAHLQMKDRTLSEVLYRCENSWAQPSLTAKSTTMRLLCCNA